MFRASGLGFRAEASDCKGECNNLEQRSIELSLREVMQTFLKKQVWTPD